MVAYILDSCCNFVLRTVDEVVLNGFCLSTAVAGAGVVQRYLVQIIVESAFSESKSVRETSADLVSKSIRSRLTTSGWTL